MKTLAKIVFGIIAYKQITGDFGTPFNRRKPVSKTGTRTNMARSVIPVSYTHLTLPTIYSV